MVRSLLSFISGLALISLVAAPAAATIGAGSLEVVGVNSTPTHFDIAPGTPTTATICGVLTSEVGDPLPETLTVWVQSSAFGNTMLTATRVGTTDCYEFTYTPHPGACNTTVVSYVELGLVANNDIADDGVVNGSGTAAAGFRFVDEHGNPIECSVPNTGHSWGTLKTLFR